MDGGGFSDVFQGRKDKQIFCLKVIRINTEVMLRVCPSSLIAVSRAHSCYQQVYAKEAILWDQLDHPNITPFYGAYYLDEAREQVCLVSPWMRNGNIVVYLKNNSGTPREPLVSALALSHAQSYSILS